MKALCTVLFCLLLLPASPDLSRAASCAADPEFDDAVILTLRLQSGIRLDAILEARIGAALKAARAALDTLNNIHAFPEYHPAQLIVETGEAWAEAWRKGLLVTGYAPVDSINRLYEVVSAREGAPGSGWFVLSFSKPLKMDALAPEYGIVPGMLSARPNRNAGDGDDIVAMYKGGEWYLVFSHGWGDCPSGCIHHSYWYVRVNAAGEAVVESVAPDAGRALVVHRWNVPARYAATAFRSVDAMLDGTRSADWWVRRHAVTVLGRLYTNDLPWSVEDAADLTLFNSLRTQALDLRGAVDRRLRAMASDPDPDVREAVREAGLAIPATSIGHQQYYPLALGNTWRFTSNGGAFTERITDVDLCIPTGYLFDTLRGVPNASLSFLNGDSLVLGACQDSILFLNFAAKPGESWIMEYPPGGAGYKWTVTLESTTDTVTVPAGRFTDVYRFQFKFEGLDNDWVEYYAPGVGPIKRTLFGIGVIDYELESHTQVGVGDTPPAVSDFELLPHHPQPAFDEITFGFTTRAPRTDVELRVYDALGRSVGVPFRSEVSAGTHAVPYAIGELARGVYFYMVHAGNIRMTRPFIVIR